MVVSAGSRSDADGAGFWGKFQPVRRRASNPPVGRMVHRLRMSITGRSSGAGSVMKAMRRMSPPQAGHASGKSSALAREELSPCDSRGVVGTGVFVGPGTLTPALSQRERRRGCGVGQPAEIPDRQRRYGRSERVIGGKDAVVAVAMPSRRGHEIGEAVEELEGREVDHAVLARGGGLALPAWSVRRLSRKAAAEAERSLTLISQRDSNTEGSRSPSRACFPRCFHAGLIPPVRLSASSLRHLPSANTHPPGPPTGTDRKPIAAGSRSCRPQ